ncbi:acyl-CoA thioesterase [Novosphingobium percolationis]|uniref:acyl-CoA thioesterase n=1 Tax=Novosphingobium percolationis TaxID=2871811 RepID=UPI001CD2AB10|nr:thioesterase family protein [Novosphingobium percolationis]
MARSDYGYFTPIVTRWADCDAYGHVNNAQYYSYFDSALTTMLIDRGVLRSTDWDSIGLCIESQCQFHASLEFPATLDVAVRIGKLGGKSIRYELAIFEQGAEQPSATGYFVHVFVDPATRRPVELTPGQREAVADLVTG